MHSGQRCIFLRTVRLILYMKVFAYDAGRICAEEGKFYVRTRPLLLNMEGIFLASCFVLVLYERSYAVALYYKPEGHGFDSRWFR
jgi:hypothetical protein